MNARSVGKGIETWRALSSCKESYTLLFTPWEKPQGQSRAQDAESCIPFPIALFKLNAQMPHVHPRSLQNRAMPASLTLNTRPCGSWQPAGSGLSVFGLQSAACPAIYSLGTSKADEPQIWNSARRGHITTKPPPPPCAQRPP